MNTLYEYEQLVELRKIAINTADILPEIRIINKLLLAQSQHRKEQEYYTDILFKANKLLDIVTQIKNPLLRYHFYHAFLVPMHQQLVDGIYELTHYEDKERTDELVQQLEKLGNDLKLHEKNYQNSRFPEMYRLAIDYEKQRKAIPPLKTGFISLHKPYPRGIAKINTIGLFIFTGLAFLAVAFLVGFNIIANNANVTINIFLGGVSIAILILVGICLLWQSARKDEQKLYEAEEIEFYQKLATKKEQRKAAENQLTQHPLFLHMQRLEQEFIQYKPILTEIELQEQRFEKKWKNTPSPKTT